MENPFYVFYYEYMYAFDKIIVLILVIFITLWDDVHGVHDYLSRQNRAFSC